MMRTILKKLAETYRELLKSDREFLIFLVCGVILIVLSQVFVVNVKELEAVFVVVRAFCLLFGGLSLGLFLVLPVYWSVAELKDERVSRLQKVYSLQAIAVKREMKVFVSKLKRDKVPKQEGLVLLQAMLVALGIKDELYDWNVFFEGAAYMANVPVFNIFDCENELILCWTNKNDGKEIEVSLSKTK